MSEDIYTLLLWVMIVLAPIVLLVLLFISAPYGRYERPGWGPVVSGRTGWLVMEAPASLLMLAVFLLVPVSPVIFVFLAIWQIHYLHRAFIYPFSLRGARDMPVLVVLMAVVFNTANAVLNGGHFILHADWYSLDWFQTLHFWVGLLLFFAGFFVTKRADAVLRNLRAPGECGYRIPSGPLYRWVSCPNYLGEIIQWTGWAVMTLSPAGWVFLLWTIANLLPRAISHHRWYRANFAEYPQSRRALIPTIL